MEDDRYDGSISLGVNIEWDGAERSIKEGYSKLKGKLQDLSAKLSKALSVKLTGSKNNKLESDFKNATFRAETLKIKLEELQSKLSEINNREFKPALSELDKGTVESFQEELSYYKSLYEQAKNSKKSRDIDLYGGLIEATQGKIDAINSKGKQAFDEKLQLDIEKTNLKIEKTRYQLSRVTEEAELAKEKLETSQNALKLVFDKVGESLKKLAQRFKNYATRTIIFYGVIKALRSLLDTFKKVLMADEDFRNDWNELTAALYVAVQPIIELLLPAMKTLVGIAKDWAISLGKVMAMLSGKTYSQLVDIAKASKQAADDYESMADSAKSAANSTKQQLAAFDDLQQFGSTSETTSDNYESFDTLKEEDTNSVTSNLIALAKAISGLLVAIGVILLFKGMVKWGLGFIIAGAAVYGVSEIADKVFNTDSVKQMITDIAGILIGGGLVAIGMLLIKFGQLGWGLGFIAAGAVELVEEIVAHDETLTEIVQSSIGGIMAIIGGAMLAVGVVLLACGNIPLGLAVIVTSIADLYTVISINWDTIVSTISDVFTSVKNWVETYGKLALGIVLLFCGIIGIPFGLKLIYDWAKENSGSIQLADTILENVQTLTNEINSSAEKMINGIVDSFNWIVDGIENIWSEIESFWNANIAKFFTANYWKQLGETCIDGLSNGIKTGVNTIISWVETIVNGISSCAEKMINGIIGGLNKISFELPDWKLLGDLAGKKYGINITNVDFSDIKIPRLAQGAVIPANREFLAVLGDQKQGANIETPLSTMIEAFNTALEGYRGSGDTTVVLEIDGREFGRAVVQSSDKENRRIGTKLVVI